MPMPRLTPGAIEAIMAGEQLDRPILQVLGNKKMGSGQGPDRYRLLLSDGVHSHSSAMLATQLNDKVTSGQLDNNAVISLDKYICNPIQPDRRVMILLELTVLHAGRDIIDRIGNPQPLRSASGETGQQTAPQNSSVDSGLQQNRAPARPMSTNAPLAPMQVPQTNQPAYPATKGFYGNHPTQPAAKQPYTVQNVPTTDNGDTPLKVHPISSLTPYQNRWTIKARVTVKSAIRTWSNSRGEGKLFTFNLLDDSGEIRATAFKAEVDKFFNVIEVNKVYLVRRATLKTADKRFSSLQNEYEMTLNNDSEVIPCDDCPDLPVVSFNFVRIDLLEQQQPNSMVDVIGIVKSVDDLKSIIGKQSNKEVKKRDLTLVDESKVQVRLTLWGNDAESFDGSSHPVMAIRGCRVSDWGGRSLSTLNSSQILLNPDISECYRLRGWYDSVGATADYSEYKRDGSQASTGSGTTVWKAFSDIKAQNLGQDKVDYFTCKATVLHMKKDNCMYQACPQQDCNKKVIDQGNGMYRCEKCQKEFPQFKYRLILSVNLADVTNNLWVTCFQDTAETILGAKADEVGALKDSNEAAYDQMFANAAFQSYIFRLRSKMETYNDENRMKTVCVQATPISHKEYSDKLLADLTSMLGLKDMA